VSRRPRTTESTDETVTRSHTARQKVDTSSSYYRGSASEPAGDHVNSWTITNLQLRPHAPEILASTDDARAIALMIPAGESLDDHQVHERA
jgi:hypothetical protein